MVEVCLATDGLVNEAHNYGDTTLLIVCSTGHLEVIKVLTDNKANVLYRSKFGKKALDVVMNAEIKQLIMNHPWHHRRPPLVTRPHNIQINT